MVDRRDDNRRWKSIDDLWKDAFDDNIPALTVTQHPHSQDAFGRLRTAGTGQRLDVEFLYDKQPNVFDETTTNGTATHNTNTRDVTLSLADANDGSLAKMASYPVPYTPGNSQLIEITGVLDLADIGTGTAETFVRTSTSGSAVETTIPQSSWVTNKTGVDWSQSHIFVMDFQSLKVGTIRFGLYQSGKFFPVAQIDNDNVRDSGYWQLANGPVYYKLYTTGGNTYMEIGYGNENNAIGFRYVVSANASATMKAICCTVKSEGGLDLRNVPGFPRTANTGVTEISVSTTLVPVLSIRSKTTFNSLENLVLSRIESLNVTSTQPILIKVIEDATITTPSWVDVDTDESSVEYDVSSTAISGGKELLSFYVTSGSGNNPGGEGATLGKQYMWDHQSALSGVVTIAAQKTGNNDANVLAAINWEEIR